MKEQYILGINGWAVRSHDTSAVLIRCAAGKTEIIAAAEEERFTRIKHAYGTVPHNAVRFCLEEGEISPEDISIVALSWDMPKIYRDRHIHFEFDEQDFLNSLFASKLRKHPKLQFVGHHLSHALSAFSPSGFDSAAVLVIDGQGETESTSIWKADENGITQISVSGISASLGYFYEALTEYVGFRDNQAGKTMGLAPYGDNQQFFYALEKLFSIEDLLVRVPSFGKMELGKQTTPYIPIDEQEQVRAFWLKRFGEIMRTGPNNSSKKYSFREFPKPYLNLASSGQEVLETIVVKLAEKIREQTSLNELCLAGGVALNCVANGRITTELGIKLYVQPAANDAGAALGAALEIARQQGYPVTKVNMTPYLGKAYSDEEILTVLQDAGVIYEEKESMETAIGRLIAEGKVVGLFQGRFEFGPRALGNRSFIADPRSVETWNYVNKIIKRREEGRPLAPTVLSKDVQSFFGKQATCPHMTIAHTLIDDKLKGVRHVDGSTRPQILEYADNPTYHEQISTVGREIGVNAVINTSLNLQEPIINSPQEALNLLHRTAVDAIIFNNRFVVYKK